MKKIKLLLFSVFATFSQAQAQVTTTEEVTVESAAVEVKTDDDTDYYRIAFELYKNKKYKEALININKAINEDPTSIENYVLKAYIFAYLKEYENVITTANLGLKLDDENDQLYDLKANSLSFLGKNDEALLAYEKMLQFEKLNARYYNNYLATLIDERVFDAAIRVYQTYLDSMEEYSQMMKDNEQFEDDIHFYGSLAYYYTNNKEKALELLNKSIDINPNFAGYYSNRANIYSDKKDNTNALLDYNKAISLSQKDGLIYYNRGSVYLDMDKYDEALKDFKLAQKYGFEDSDFYQNLGSAYKGLKKYDDALKSFNKAIELNPDNKQVYNNLALLYKDLGRKEESDLAYKKAIENGFETHVPFYNQGYDAMKRKDYKTAIPYLEKAIESNPEFVEAYNQLGICYTELDDEEKALEMYTKGIIKNPKYAILYHNRGNTYKNLQKYKEAKDDYLEAVRLNPEQTTAYYVLAKMYMQLNDDNQAQQYFNLAEESNLSIEQFYIDYVSFLSNSNQYQKALEIAEKGIKNYPKSYKLLVNLGITYADNNQVNMAIETLKKAINVNSEESSAYYNLGNFYFLRKKDLKNAEKNYLLAIEKNTLDSEPYLNLASVYQDMGDKNKMMKTMQSLIEKFPNSYTAYYNLADFLYKQGETEKAINYFEKSFELMDNDIKNSKNNAYRLNIEKSEKSLLKAQAYQMMKKYDKAVPCYQTYIAFNSLNDVAFSNYAYCLLEIGKPDDALINFEKAFNLNENEIDTVIGLILTNYLLRDNSSVKKYTKIIEKKFKNYKVNPNLLQDLSKEGYFYSQKIITIWNEAIAK